MRIWIAVQLKKGKLIPCVDERSEGAARNASIFCYLKEEDARPWLYNACGHRTISWPALKAKAWSDLKIMLIPLDFDNYKTDFKKTIAKLERTYFTYDPGGPRTRGKRNGKKAN